MNHYPLWKNLLLLGVILFSLLLAWPNLYSQDPAIEITAARGAEVTEASIGEVRAALENASVPVKGFELREGGKLLVRFAAPGDQLKGQEAIERSLSVHYRTALTQSADLPGWMRAVGLKPMNLGLDLRGGIHVVIDVDMEAALEQALERYVGDMRTQLRDDKIRYLTVTSDQDRILVKFNNAQSRDAGAKVLKREFRDLNIQTADEGNSYLISAVLLPAQQKQIKDFALQQNITTLRNRVNELGVAEPLIQQQGEGASWCSSRACRTPAGPRKSSAPPRHSSTAWSTPSTASQQAVAGHVPAGCVSTTSAMAGPILLEAPVIFTGD